MKQTKHLNGDDVEFLQARLGATLAAALGERADAMPNDFSARLRFAREQAVAQARSVRLAQATPAVVAVASGVASFGAPPPWWLRLATALPLVVLAGGLVLIHDWQLREQVAAAAQIDAVLLADTVPPAAYADPGFVEFLKDPVP